MQKKAHVYLPIFALIMGVCGAVLRAVELVRSFEPDTGLLIPVFAVQAMRWFTIAVVLLSALFAFLTRGELRNGLHLLSGEEDATTKTLCVAGCFLLLAAAAYNYVGYRQVLRVSEIILLLFAAFSAVSLLIRVSKPGEEYRIFSLVPVFWCCFWLVLIYRDRSINPVVEDYIYELFAVVAITLFFYGLIGYDFGSRKRRASVFFGLVAIYLCVVTSFGPIIAAVIYKRTIVYANVIMYYAACAVIAMGGVHWLIKNGRTAQDTDIDFDTTPTAS